MSAPGVRIRPALRADEPVLRACARAAYARYAPRIGRDPAPLSADYAAQIAAGWVHLADTPEGTAQGFIVFYPQDRAMLLENVAVFPQFAGCGVGKALIDHCETSARAAGFACVRLYTNEKMVENLSLYPALGYHETARKTEDGFARIYFEKPLT